MLATRDEELWRWAWSFKDHGKSWDAVYNREHAPGFRWLHESFGTNWRLTEMQAAIGRLQLRKLPSWREARARNAARYAAEFAGLEALRVPQPPADTEHAWYKFYAYVRPEMLKSDWSRDRFIAEISARGVPCFSGSCSEIYLERAFDGTDLRPKERLAVARELGETSLMFLVHPTLSDAQAEQMAAIAAEVVRSGSR